MEILNMLVGTLLRHGAAVLGAWLVGKGYMSADDAAKLGEYMIGGGLIIASTAASIYFKKKALEATPK